MTGRTRGRGLLESPAQISVLASPVRQEIVDTLESLGGEAAVAEIAAHLGRPADGIYYHLRRLVRSGLLEELPERGGRMGRGGRMERGGGMERGGRKGRRYRTVAGRGRRISLRYRGGKGGNAKAVSRVVAALLRMAKRDFDRALSSGKAVVEGERRELWASRTKGWVGNAELVEINRLLVRLDGLLHRPRSARRNRLLSLAWVLAPVPARPLRRGRRLTG